MKQQKVWFLHGFWLDGEGNKGIPLEIQELKEEELGS